MLFAQTNVPAGFAAWMACLGFGLLILNQLYMAAGNFLGKKSGTEISPQPLDVRISHEFVRRDECQGRHSESVAKIQAVEKQLATLRQEREEDVRQATAGRKALYQKIEAVQRDFTGQLSAVYGKVDSVRKELGDHNEAIRRELSGKIDDVPNQVIATLKNTNAI